MIVIRPEPGCSATAETARNFGLAAACHPLFDVVPIGWTMPDEKFDAVLAGSANAFRCGGPLVDKLVDKPVYAVGEQTAAAARAKGFRIAAIGIGGLQSLLDAQAGTRLRLLRISGEERVVLTPPPGIEITEVAAYRAEPRAIPAEMESLLRRGAAVLLHSAAAASHLAREVDRLQLDRGRILLAALGPRIAGAAGEGWAAKLAAAEPNDRSLLALALEMCHDPSQGRGGRQ